MNKICVFLAKWAIFNIGIIFVVFSAINAIDKWDTSMTFGNSIWNVVGTIVLFLIGVIVTIVGLVI